MSILSLSISIIEYGIIQLIGCYPCYYCFYTTYGMNLVDKFIMYIYCVKNHLWHTVHISVGILIQINKSLTRRAEMTRGIDKLLLQTLVGCKYNNIDLLNCEFLLVFLQDVCIMKHSIYNLCKRNASKSSYTSYRHIVSIIYRIFH